MALNELLKVRFGALPADLPAKLSAASDPNALKALIPSAYAAESLQAFIALLDKTLSK